VLPPTLVEKPNPKANLDGGPLYLNTERSRGSTDRITPRTAGVEPRSASAGANFHTVLEEYTGTSLNRPNTGLRQWPAELLVWRRTDNPRSCHRSKTVRDAIAAGAQPTLADLAASAWQSSRRLRHRPPLVAIVAATLDDLKDKIDLALEAVPKAEDAHADPRGVYFRANPVAPGKVAFLFPGQGSQYPDMLAQVAMAFPEVRDVLDRAESTLAGDLDKPLSRFISPPSPFTPEQEATNRTNSGGPRSRSRRSGRRASAMFRLLTALGVEADYFAGHSYGEYTALAAAGRSPKTTSMRLSYKRGRAIREAAVDRAGRHDRGRQHRGGHRAGAEGPLGRMDREPQLAHANRDRRHRRRL